MPHQIKRDKYFWTIALQTVCVNIFLGSFGPAQPLLRADQGTSLTIAGLHGTALGVASIAAGFANPHLAHRFGRSRTGWMGLGFFAVGLTLFVASPPVLITIIAALITGFGTSITINNSLTSINNHYGKMAPIAITQANGIASAGYVIGTLAVGTIATNYRDFWRLGMLLALPLVAFLYFVMRDKSPEVYVPSEHGPQNGKLSGTFWIAWIGFVACISSEFATSFWAAALVLDRTAASPAFSTLVIAALGTGMGIGRWYWGRILKVWHLDTQLQFIIAVQFAGFTALWFSHNIYISFFSLLVIGLGISSQFALASLRLIGLSENRPDLAIGKSSLAAGIAIGGAPFLLGVLGDSFGISRAYIMVPILIVIAYLVVQFVPSHVEEKIEL
jgi:predicted MFS family arabinose efflux permease|tara:strand:+ start:4434 stop:5597 length:1164 start_codon:yes stop_codon:yes gene_type:complete